MDQNYINMKKALFIYLIFLSIILKGQNDTVPTQNVNDAINAAYDSKRIVDEMNSYFILDSDQTQEKDRNLMHIQIMLRKEWFYSELTEEQKNDFEQLK